MFKANNKGTRLFVSSFVTLDIFHTFFIVSVVDFEQVNVFSGTIVGLSSGNDDVDDENDVMMMKVFNFLWHIINTIYFNVMS